MNAYLVFLLLTKINSKYKSFQFILGKSLYISASAEDKQRLEVELPPVFFNYSDIYYISFRLVSSCSSCTTINNALSIRVKSSIDNAYTQIEYYNLNNSDNKWSENTAIFNSSVLNLQYPAKLQVNIYFLK